MKKCIENAGIEYSRNWTDACYKIAENKKLEIENCAIKLSKVLASKDDEIAQCKMVYGIPDFSDNCMLPVVTASDLNNRLAEQKMPCSKR